MRPVTHNIQTTGGSGADTLVTTATTAVLSNDDGVTNSEVRFNPGTRLTFAGATAGDQIIALAGNVTIAGDPGATAADAASGPQLVVSAGATAFLAGSLDLSQLNIMPGGLARMPQAGTSVLAVNFLNLAPATPQLPGGILDLADNSLIVQSDDQTNEGSCYGYYNEVGTVTGYLAAGYDGGCWDDLGSSGPAPAAIISSTAANDPTGLTTLGVAGVGATGSPSAGLFAGQPVVDGDVVVRSTYVGDANLDGVVDSADQAVVAAGESSGATGWSNGDFNYDGVVNADDAALARQNDWTTGLALTPAMENQPYTLTLPAAAVEANLGITTITGWSVNFGDGSGPIVYPGNTSTASYNYSPIGAGMYSVAISVTGTIGGQYVTFNLPQQDLVMTPDAPAGLAATESTAGQVDLSWTDDEYFPLNYVVTAMPTGGGQPVEMNVSGNATSCSMANLSPGVVYSFSVAAVNELADGHYALSVPEAAINATVPGATLSVTGPQSIDEGVTGQLLSLGATSASSADLDISSWGIVWTDGCGTVLATDTVLASYGTVAFPTPDSGQLIAAITANDVLGDSLSLPLFDVEVSPEPTSKPVATVVSSSEVQVAWVAASQIADGYIVKRSDNDNRYHDVAVLSGSATSFDDTTVRPGTTVDYKIEAVVGSKGAISDSSDPVYVPGGAPQIVSVAAGPAGTGTAIVNWSYVGLDDSGFEIEGEDQTAGTNFVLMATPGALDANATTGTCTVSNLAGDDVYQFRIRADHFDNTVSVYATQSGTIQMVPDAAAFADMEYGGATWAEIDWYNFPTSEVVGGFKVFVSTTPTYGTTPSATASPTATSAVVSGLTANTQYWFEVVAFNAAGNSLGAENQFTTFDHDLATPTGLSVVAAGGSTTFSYNSAPGTTVWVQGLLENDVANSGGSPWYTYFNSAPPNGATDLEDSVPAGETWRARTVGGSANWVSESWSQTAVSTSDDTEQAPTRVAATPTSSTQVQISWTPDPNAPIGDVTGYTIDCWVQGGTAPLNYTVSESATAAVVGNLLPSTKYFFAVSAKHIEGFDGDFAVDGPASVAFSATTMAAPPSTTPVYLNPPANLKATWDAAGNTQVNHHATVSWQNISNNETVFQVEWSTDPAFPDSATHSNNVPADQTTLQILTCDYNHNYYFRVRAGAGGVTSSSWSNVAELSPGPIIVVFYGADYSSALRAGSNPDLQKMYKRLVNEGYQIKGFQGLSIGADPVGDAEQWILDNIGQAHPGTYDPNNGDISRNIEIIGYSVGGADVAYLANKILYDTRFHDEIVSLAVGVDPVTRYTSGDSTVPGTVLDFWNLIETQDLARAGGAPVFYSHINGVFLPSNAQINHYFDVTTDYGPLRNTEVDHLNFINEIMFTFLIGLLKGNQQ